MSNPPSSIEDAKLGTVNMGAKARMMHRKQRLGLIAGLVLGLALLVSLPLAVVYGLRSRRNSEVKIEETSEDSVLCSPKAYSAGQWVWDPKTNITEMTSKEQALLFSGFETCANDMLSWWNLGANLPEKYFRLPKAQSYRWEPGSKCQGLSPLDPGALLKHLVEIGGWYIVGDSVGQNHFFSISCVLGPHVTVSPENPPGDSLYGHSAPSHLYLNPASAFMSSLTLPIGFNISSTPLVTVRRIDLLFSSEEVEALYWSAQDKPYMDGGKSIYTHEKAYTIPMDTYLNEFIQPLPTASYSTMITSTGGHWAQFHFNGTSPAGIPGILNLFAVVAKRWADHFQEVVGKANQECLAAGESCKHPRRRRAIIRDFVEGHYECETKFDPWTDVGTVTAPPDYWNWLDMPRFNAVWKDLLGRKQYSDIDHLPIARPGQLRPDAHTNGDCLHPMTGAGIAEGWTQYILHFLTKESP